MSDSITSTYDKSLKELKAKALQAPIAIRIAVGALNSDDDVSFEETRPSDSSSEESDDDDDGEDDDDDSGTPTMFIFGLPTQPVVFVKNQTIFGHPFH